MRMTCILARHPPSILAKFSRCRFVVWLINFSLSKSRWIEGWLLPGLMLLKKLACCQVTADVLVSLSTSHSTTVYQCLFWSWCQRSVFVLKRWSLVLIQYKESRHMAGNSPTADIRRWWDRLSPQWEFLSQLGILILLGQHFDIDQDLGMTCMKTIKKR